jgi:hypothetical protein
LEISDSEKLKLGIEGIKAFVEQFPNDANAKILMEVLWDELLIYKSNESLSIPGEKK